jgi:PAS domain S-box-containing protein
VTTPTPLRSQILDPLPAADPRAPAALPADFLERLPIGVLVFSERDMLVLSNPMAVVLLGFQPAAIESRLGLLDRLAENGAALRDGKPGTRHVLPLGGRLIEVEVHPHADGGIMWMMLDKSSELRLRAQLTEEASFLAHSHEAFLVVDQNGFIRYANPFCERERGYETNGLIGRNLAQTERWCSPAYEETREVSGSDLRARLQQVVKDGGPLSYNAWHRRLDGGELPVEVSMRPHRMSYETVVLVIARDDSRRLMHLQALIQAKAEAEAANRAKSAFLAITSHELRTPLTGIMGFCELLQFEISASDEVAARYLQLIAESSQSLLTIINDIVDLSKIEARTLEIRPVQVDVVQVLELTTQLWSKRAEAKGLKLVRLPQIGSARTITTDSQRLRQMLDNLLSNAVKFTEKGEISLTIQFLADGIELTVADTGCGIAEGQNERVFEAFWQIADHTTRANGGNGLGLYICRSLAELLGGKVWLHATNKGGSVFKLRLPLGVAHRPSARLMKSDVWIHTPTGVESARER